eukprot:7652804-Karenia_brevis.AAC.1
MEDDLARSKASPLHYLVIICGDFNSLAIGEQSLTVDLAAHEKTNGVFQKFSDFGSADDWL